MRVAIVHEWLTNLAGSERVVLALARLFPGAPVYTSVHDPARLGPAFAHLDVRETFLGRVPGARRRHQLLLPFLPLAFEQLDMRGYDLVLCSHHACAHGVIADARALTVAYVHTPMRYAWSMAPDYQATLPAAARLATAPLLHALRMWDRAASQRVDRYVANSREVAGRIRRCWGREAEVVAPPVRVGDFAGGLARDPGEHFLVVSRLVPYKRVELAVAAAKAAKRSLRVVGDGPLYKQLRRAAGPETTFLGTLTDAEVRAEYAACRALLFPGLEDFGIVPVEAMASGRPVIAYGRGGALDTVVPGVSGWLVGDQTAEAFAAAMRRAEAEPLAPAAIARHAALFDEAAFDARLGAMIAHWYAEHVEAPRPTPTAV